MAEIRKLKNSIVFDADKIAIELGNFKGTNMVILGAASKYLKIDIEQLEKAITDTFARKGEAIVESNINSLRAGRAVALISVHPSPAGRTFMVVFRYTQRGAPCQLRPK